MPSARFVVIGTDKAGGIEVADEEAADLLLAGDLCRLFEEGDGFGLLGFPRLCVHVFEASIGVRM